MKPNAPHTDPNTLSKNWDRMTTGARELMAETLMQRGTCHGVRLLAITPHYKGFLWWKRWDGYVAALEYEQPNPFFHFRTGAGANPYDAIIAAIRAL